MSETLAQIRARHNGHCQCGSCDVPQLFAALDAKDARIAELEAALGEMLAAYDDPHGVMRAYKAEIIAKARTALGMEPQG